MALKSLLSSDALSNGVNFWSCLELCFVICACLWIFGVRLRAGHVLIVQLWSRESVLSIRLAEISWVFSWIVR